MNTTIPIRVVAFIDCRIGIDRTIPFNRMYFGHEGGIDESGGMKKLIITPTLMVLYQFVTDSIMF